MQLEEKCVQNNMNQHSVLSDNANTVALQTLKTQEKPMLANAPSSTVAPSSFLQKFIDTGDTVFKDAAGHAMDALTTPLFAANAAAGSVLDSVKEFPAAVSNAVFKPISDGARKAASILSSNQEVTDEPNLPYSKLRGSDADAILNKTLSGIASNESAGQKQPYMAVNHNTNGTTDYGKYQVNSTVLKELSMKYLGRSVTPAQFIASPALQEQFAKNRVDHMLKQGYSDKEVASMWHHGTNSVFSDSDPYVRKYVEATPTK